VIGYELFFLERWQLKLEAYYQYLYDVPVEKYTPSYFSALNQEEGFVYFALSNAGTGRNYGIETTLEHPFSNGWYALTTVSLFDSKYKGSNAIEKNTLFNVGSIVNLLGGKEFKLNSKNSLNFNIKLTWSGGKRYTPIDLEASKTGYETIYNESLTYAFQLADYFRIDAQLNYKINNRRVAHELKLEVQNITNRLNQKGIYFDRETKNVAYTYQLGLIPVISYRIVF
jgi:hypothetical protein